MSQLNMTKNSFTEGYQSRFSLLQTILEEKLHAIGTKLEPYRETLEDSLSQAFHSLPENVQHSLQSTQGAVFNYYRTLSNTSTQELINDISQLKATPATVTLLVTVTIIASLALLPVKAARQKSKHKGKKKPSKAQRANKQIQAILDFVEETYVPQIDAYLESFGELSAEDRQYKYKYFEEMLLVELMKLDDVDVSGNEVLRANRKKVIRFIQDHQKRLDTVKKELEE